MSGRVWEWVTDSKRFNQSPQTRHFFLRKRPLLSYVLIIIIISISIKEAFSKIQKIV